jgi:hypothetical protein
VAKMFTDRSGVVWELVEGDDFAVGSYIKNVPGPGDICAGVQRVILWNPDGPVQVGCANERPSRDFYVAVRDNLLSDASPESRAQADSAQKMIDTLDSLGQDMIPIAELTAAAEVRRI